MKLTNNTYILLNLIEAFYVFYMMNYFKTSYSLHLPLENITKYNKFLIHPINTGHYQSKICPLGHLIGFLLPIWILIRVIYKNSTIVKNINIIIWVLIFVLSFIMNINAFIYFIPAFVIETMFLT
jgi:hypothetical protein